MPSRRGAVRSRGRSTRTIPSLVTVVALLATAALLPVWWGDGTYAALSLATGYTAAALLVATLLLTPVVRLRRHRQAPVHLPLRRSLGVHAGLMALVHVAVSFPVHLGGDVMRYFVDADGDVLVTRFGLSNWIGLAAAVAFGILLVTSTDGWLRRLGARRWKRLHLLAFAAAGLSLVHTIGYQTIRDAWPGLTAALVVATLGLLYVRLLGRRAVRTHGLARGGRSEGPTASSTGAP